MNGFSNRFRNAFSIDLEVLAIFRVLLAVVVIWGLLGRTQIRDYLFSPAPVEIVEADSVFLYSSLDSRLVHTPWHWSLLWMDQVVQRVQQTLLRVQRIESVELAPAASRMQPESEEQNKNNSKSEDVSRPAEPERPFWHQPLQRSHDFFAGRLWFDLVIGLGIGSAVLFAIGLFTKTSNLLLWIVVLSVQHRMPLFNSGGDSLERMFLFWLLFLPAGAMWSLDAWWFPRQGFWRKRINQVAMQRYQESLATKQPLLRGHALCNWATAALLLQLVTIYFYSGLEKLHADWFNGTAIASSLQWTFISKPWAAVLLDYPGLLTWATWFVLGIEVLCPLLVFCPFLFGYTRPATAVLLILMHIGIATTLSIGTFSILCCLGWLLFFPYPTRSPIAWRTLWREHRDSSGTLAHRIASSPRAAATALEWVVVICLTSTVWWNLAQASVLQQRLSFPIQLHPLVCQLGLDPQFPMFGRVPQRNWGWIHRVDLESGQSINIRQQLPQPLNVSNRIESLAEPHDVYLWRQLHVNLLYLQDQHPDFIWLVRDNLRQIEFNRWREWVSQPGNTSVSPLQL